MSSGVLLLPAVNRNLPRVVAQSQSGIVAYACRYHIYFIDARSTPPLVLDSKFISGAHPGKIISLSFCKQGSAELLASVGDDREIKIWDIESQTCLNSLEVKECCRVLEWIYGSSNTLVYPSDFKTITKWNTEKGAHGCHKIKADSGINVTQIVSNEKLPHLLALGFTNGTITIMDIAQETTLQKLKVHSNEITSLSWSLVSPDILLSASLDLSLRMWKMEEAQPIHSYYMQSGRHRMDDKKKMRFVGICHPTNSNAIICSNLRGDVGEIVFAESEKPKFENEKPKFSYYYQGTCDISCKSTFAFIFVSMDEGKTDLLYCFDPYKITLWNVTKKQLTSQIPFMSQFIYDLTTSNVNPNLLAISNGEGILKIWNSQSEATRLDMISVFVHFKSRIMAAAWHPVTEHLVAFGTDEGRVGIIDIVKRKIMYSFETHHTDAVYSLNWGPCEKAQKSESAKTIFYIYSVGGGVIYIHKENEAKGKALNFDDLVERSSDLESSEKTHSEITWQSDYSRLSVGSYKGYVDIYDNKFLFLNRFNVQLKTVECLRWHPQITYMSPEGSLLKPWLACSGSDMEIYILDTATINEETSTQGAFKKLVGHKKKVVSLCWSQHKDGFLVSASKDGSALVWDVLAGTIIATYLHHQDVVYAVQWSVFDQDVIYSGGQDGSVRMWKISQQTVIPVPEKAPPRKRMKKPIPGALEDENVDRLVTEKTNKEKKVVNLPSKDSSAIESATNKKALFPHYSMSSVVNREDNLDDCIKLTDILSPTPVADLDSFDSLQSSQCVLSNEDTIKFGLFADQLTALKMIENQGEAHRAAGDQFTARYLQLMTGNIQATLEEAAENHALTNFLVSMAPAVSYTFWLEMCEKFALQLVSDHFYNQASFYYLACGKIYEAVNVLADKSHFVEALALAKSRLPASDLVIPKLIRGLQKKFRGYSQVGETMCYLSLNEPLVAAKTIASTSEPNYVRVAAYICRKFNLDKEADEYRFVCLEKCFMKYDYSALKQLIQQEPCMQVYSPLAAVHEELHDQIQLIKQNDVLLNCLKDMFALTKTKEVVHFWKGSVSKLTGQPFIATVYQYFRKELLDTEKSTLLRVLDALEILSAKRMSFGTADVHITIAIYIAKFIILSLLEDTDAATVIFLKIFEASNNVYFLPKVMFSIFFPMCISWRNDASRMVCSNIEIKEIEYCNSILQSINQKMADNITSYTKQPIETFIMPNDLQSNLRFITERIGVLLSIKKAEEYMLAYFVSSIINDLMRLLEKKDLKLQCKKTTKDSKDSMKLAHSDAVPPSTITTGNPNDIAQQIDNEVCDKYDDEDIMNELIKLALQEAEEKSKLLAKKEAEEKAKSIPKQEAIESNAGTDDNTNSGDVRIESSSNDVVVECVSKFDNSSSSASAADTASEVESNEKIIEDSQTSSKNGISPEKVVAEDELIASTDEIVSEVDVSKNEFIIPDYDIIEEKFILSSSSPDISDSNISVVHQISNVNTTCNEVDVNDNENIISNTSVTPEVDRINNEKLHFNPVLIPKLDLSNSEHEIHNTSIITQVKYETNIAFEKMVLKNNENTIYSSDVMSNFDQPSQKEFIPGSVITEKIILPVDGSGNPSSNEDIHIQCLQNINMFYNIVSFVTQNICKDEFALLYYLKEKVKLLNHIRASDELNRFSKVKKTGSKVGAKANKDKNKSNLQKPADLTEIVTELQETQVEELNVKVDSTVNESNLQERANLTEIVNQSQETKVEELDVTVVDSTVKESNLQEPANLIENLNQPQETKVEELDVKVVNSTVDTDNKICANIIDYIVAKVSNLSMQSLEDEEPKNLESTEVSPNSSVEENGSKQDQVSSDISQEHNYASQIESSEENSASGHDLLNGNGHKEADSDTGAALSNLQEEISEISGLIDILEKNSEKFHYPNPFDVIPKILRALYDVVKKSSCEIVKEKLHELIHENISWAQRYFVGDINYVCKICQKTSVV